ARRRRAQADPGRRTAPRAEHADLPRQTLRGHAREQRREPLRGRQTSSRACVQLGDRLLDHEGARAKDPAGRTAAHLPVSARAGIVVTGTEVLSGRVTDRNGPWLAERLRGLGVDAAYIAIVGDRPEDMRAALEFMAAERLDLIVTSGGLG